VWGIRGGIRTRTLDSHASRLRRKLEAAGATGVVVNDWGVGRGVAGPDVEWRKVAWLQGSRPSDHVAKPCAFETFGP
jgi:hypothetical protein